MTVPVPSLAAMVMLDRIVEAAKRAAARSEDIYQ